ncbi:CMP-N-acetylneuraminate-poly-alpha-2,8-sialyltransferase-like [Glandiceps talaboti]
MRETPNKQSFTKELTSEEKDMVKGFQKTVEKLETWEKNSTNMQLLREELLRGMNRSYFMLTQDNTKIGMKYHNSERSDPVEIDHSKYDLLPKVSPFKTNLYYKTCCIVGNGGILKNSSCGKEIDSFDFVFRANLQPIQNFISDAGRKINLTTINPILMEHGFHNLENKGNVSKFLEVIQDYPGFLLYIPNSVVAPTSTAFTMASHLHSNKKVQLLLNDVEYDEKLQSLWKLEKTISTGSVLVSLGVQFCKEIHLYGFWPFQLDHHGRRSPLHYSEDWSWAQYTYNHDFSKEFKFLLSLHERGVIRLHVDSCRRD